MFQSRISSCLVLVCCCIIQTYVRSEFNMKDGQIPSYIHARFPIVNETTFPHKLVINISFTKMVGLLMYSVDGNGNQLAIKLIGGTAPQFQIIFRGNEKQLLVANMCGCTMCSYTPLLLSVSASDNALHLQCNGRSTERITDFPSKSVDDKYPLIQTKSNSSPNFAELWLVNFPKTSKVEPNSLQMHGCLFNVHYRGNPFILQPFGNAIGKNCMKTCKNEACNDGICYETYATEPLCDCTNVFGSSWNCSNESNNINKQYRQHFQFSMVKLSIRTDSAFIWQLWNGNVMVRLDVEGSQLYLTAKYPGAESPDKSLLSSGYRHNNSYVVVISFKNGLQPLQTNPLTLVWSASTDISNQIFENMILSGCNGVMDITFKVDSAESKWEKWKFSESTSEEIPCILPDDRSKLLFILLIIPCLIVIVVIIYFIFRKKDGKRKRKRKRKRRLPNTIIPDTIVPDTIVPDTIVPDTIVLDTIVPDPTKQPLIPLEPPDYPVPVELQILHWETYSMVCVIGNHKVDRIIESLKQSVSPINRPIIICCIEDPLSKLPLDFHYKSLHFEGITFQEFLVHSRRQNVEEILNEVRDWKLSDLKYDEGVSFDVKVSPVTDRWKHSRHVVVKYQLEGSDEISETVDIIIAKDLKIEKIKAVFMEYLRFFYVSSIMTAIQNNERLSREVQRNINKIAVIRSDLLTLFDHKMDRLTDYMTAEHTEIVKQGTINAIQKTVETVEFAGDLFQDGYVQESVANLILNRTLLIHSVTEEGPSLVVMRDECIDESEVSKIISPYVTVNTTLLLIHGNKVLKSNKEIDKSNDVIFYAVVNRLVDVTIGKELGKGAYSTVCECTVGSSENRLAIKKHRNDGDLQRFIRDEIVAVSGIGRHSRIMKYHRFYENAEGFYILMDSMTESLSNHVKRLYPLKESQIMNFTKQILEGLSYLHKQMVAHWDLKGSNVLLSNTGEIKLSDFGNPKFQIVQKLYKKGQLSSLEPGIVNWMAPEVIMAESRLDKFKADVWSLGATLVEIVTGMPPMYDRDPASIVTQLCNAKKIEYEFPPQYSESLRKFMDKCLISDFNTRPYCHDLPSINIT